MKLKTAVVELSTFKKTQLKKNLCILTHAFFSRSQAEDLAICQRKSAGRGTLCKTRPQGCTAQVSDTHALLIKNVQNNATIPIILIYDLILICLCCPQNRPTGQRRLWSEKAVRPFPAYPAWPEACSQIPVPAVPGVLLQPLCVGIPAAIPCTWREKRTCVPLVLQVHGQIHVVPQC